MLDRIIKPSTTNSFFLFGARGTGKTTLLKQHYLENQDATQEHKNQETLYLDLLDFGIYQDLLFRPQGLKERIQATHCQRIIIDEIQKVPALLDVIHQLIEEQRNLQFIMTGSSARKLKRGSANLLAGRAFEYHLFPLLHDEIGKNFDLTQALSWGTLPRILSYNTNLDKKEYLNAYTQTYLKQEIMEEQTVRKLEPFQRFLPIAAQSSGKQINFAKIARQAGCSPATVKSYFQILEDTLVGFFLRSFHPSVRKQELVAPKFYFFDLGVKRALARLLDLPVLPQTSYYGDTFEHFIIQQIKYLLSYHRRDEELFFYKTQGDLEIDLIIQHPARPLKLIEIKSTETIRPEHVSNLNSILADFTKHTVKEPEAICLSRDPSIKKIGAVMCYPWEQGLARTLN